MCGGPLQAHHVLSQQHLRRAGMGGRLWDTRNGVAVCESAHTDHTRATRRISVDVLPWAAWEFARECGMEWRLERYYEPSMEVHG